VSFVSFGVSRRIESVDARSKTALAMQRHDDAFRQIAITSANGGEAVRSESQRLTGRSGDRCRGIAFTAAGG
jgi:hypothetical protein